MAKRTTIDYYCDVCGEKIDEKFLQKLKRTSKEKDYKIEMSVVFLPEQTEGRYTEPYLKTVKINICEKCWEKITKEGKQLMGAGAMGYNEYFFKEAKK